MYPAKWYGKSLLWEEKPNSGDILKLKIPSHNRKVIGGLNNYSGMVTSSLKMSENEMDYRGSKSTIWKSIVVKEQRVDGFLQKKLNNFSCIRYTLMGFERNYQVKIPFNQILQKRYSTSSNINNKLTPWFLWCSKWQVLHNGICFLLRFAMILSTSDSFGFRSLSSRTWCISTL